MVLSKLRDRTPIYIPLPHPRSSLLSTPIHHIYATIPPPMSYKGKHLASCISQPIGVSSIPPL